MFASVADLLCKKLQRRISNDRGIPLSVPIPSIYPLSKESKTDNSCRQPSGALGTRECRGVAKRKYRRHPKVWLRFLPSYMGELYWWLTGFCHGSRTQMRRTGLPRLT